MSLINQMLQDLEKRRAQTATASPLGGVTPNGIVFPVDSRINYLLLGIILLLVVTVAFLIGAQRFELTRILPVPVQESVNPESNKTIGREISQSILKQVDSIINSTAQGENSDNTLSVDAQKHNPVLVEVQSTQFQVKSITQPVNANSPSAAQSIVKDVVREKTSAASVNIQPAAVRAVRVDTLSEITMVIVELDRRSTYEVKLEQKDSNAPQLVLKLRETTRFEAGDATYKGTPVVNMSTAVVKDDLQLHFDLDSPQRLLGASMEEFISKEKAKRYRLVVRLSALPKESHPVKADKAAALQTAEPEKLEKLTRPLTAAQRAELAFQEAVVLIGRDQQAKAMEVLAGALDLDPRHDRAREILASLLLNNGRVIEAGTTLETGLNLMPASAPLAKLYARILLNQGDFNQAISVLEQAAPNPQTDLDYYALLAAMYQKAGRFSDAANMYRRILDIRPGVANWWLGLGLSQESLGESENALESYKQSRQRGGLNAEVRNFVSGRIAAIQAAMPVKSDDNKRRENYFGEQF